MATVPYSAELLKGACLAHGLAVHDADDAATLHDKLGARLVADLLAPPTAARAATAKRKPRTGPAANRAAWLAFVARERPLIEEAGLSGRLAVQELGARWKRFKARDAPGAPLRLPAPGEAGSSSSEDDGALEGMRATLAEELDDDTLDAALAAHGAGLDASLDRAGKLDALARALLA